jgi:carboxymethylenebutenolidase
MFTLKRPDGNQREDFHLSRRGAIGGVFFAGYAAAALSADADPIHTDEVGLKTETVQLASGIPAYVARPAVKGRYPAVLVISEIFGVHEYIRDICRRFAKLGYVAIAPAFFVRVGDPAPLPMSQIADIMKIVAAAPDPQVMGDILSAVGFLKTQHYVDASRMAVTGFCWGGRWTWLACEDIPDIKAGAAWYGQLAPAPTAPADPNKLYPINLASHLSAPVLGLYGGQDQLSKAVPAMRAELDKDGKTGSEIVVYPDAGHGFHADYRASYNKADAEDGWARMLAHFKNNGVGPGKA